jgi:hypothetical protein
MRRSRVESDSNDFRSDNELTRSRDRVEDFFSRVICRLRIDLERNESRLSEQCLILKNLLHSTVLLLARDRISISSMFCSVSQFIDYCST